MTPNKELREPHITLSKFNEYGSCIDHIKLRTDVDFAKLVEAIVLVIKQETK